MYSNDVPRIDHTILCNASACLCHYMYNILLRVYISATARTEMVFICYLV